MEEVVGFVPPTPLQLAQRRLALAMSQLPDPTTTGFGLRLIISDLVDMVGLRLSSMRFPRVGAKVSFTVGNVLSIDTASNRQYDRIYVGAQAQMSDYNIFREPPRPFLCCELCVLKAGWWQSGCSRRGAAWSGPLMASSSA